MTKRVTLDELDIKILNSLSRNCRASYDRMSPEIGLSSKSIKARVNKMQSIGVIHNFVVKINLKVLDYSRFSLLIVKYEKPDDDRNIVHRLNLVGDIIGRLDGIGNMSAFLIAIKGGSEEKLKLLIDGLGQNLVQNQYIIFPDIDKEPSNTDFKIIRCLLSNPRIGISDIAQAISMSSKTVTRRLENMIENRILEFSVLCNLTVMSGYMISIVSANVGRTSYRNVLEKIYAELENSFLLRSPFLGQDNVMIFILCSKDTVALDSFTRKLESYSEVKKVDVFITTRVEYFKDVVIKEIEKKINDTERTRKRSLRAEKIPNIVTRRNP